MKEQIKTVTGQLHPKLDLDITGKDSKDVEKYCKVCGNRGVRVLQVTVTTHVRPEHWNLLSEGFWFCETTDCPIIYFNNRTETYFAKDEIKTRFGPKETADPRPLCYCLGILEEHIRYEILRKGCCDSLQDIVEYTKAGTGKWCLTTNPSGKCCREYLKGVVDKYLAMKEAKLVQPKLKAIKTSVEHVEQPAKKLTLKIEGMTCESCAVAVASALEKTGGSNVRVSFKDGVAELAAGGEFQPDDAVKAVVDLGYEAKVLKVDRMQP